MLHIILLILKVIGIILLVLLGLILTLFLVVTLVPVRYKGQGSYYEKPVGSIKITWLLHLISIVVSYKEELAVTVRLFGIRILKEQAYEPLSEAGEAAEQALKRTAGRIADEGIPEFVKETPDYGEEPMVSVQEVKPLIEDPKIRPEEENGRLIDKQTRTADGQPQKTETSSQKKKSVFHRLFGKIKAVFHRLTVLIKNIIGSMKKAGDARQEIMSFLTDEENKKTFHLIVRQAKKVMHHVFPRKLTGHVTFGFEDPYTTGQILTGAALLYPLYQNKFSVIPVFDRKIVEGEFAFRGRVRLGVFLKAGIEILLNRNFRTQLKKFMNRGGM